MSTTLNNRWGLALFGLTAFLAVLFLSTLSFACTEIQAGQKSANVESDVQAVGILDPSDNPQKDTMGIQEQDGVDFLFQELKELFQFERKAPEMKPVEEKPSV